LDFDAVGVNVIQAEQLVLDRKDTIADVPNYFWLYVIGSGDGKPHGAGKRLILSANRGADNEDNPYSKYSSQRGSHGANPISLPGSVIS
jgi:hypothetical protein